MFASYLRTRLEVSTTETSIKKKKNTGRVLAERRNTGGVLAGRRNTGDSDL